METDPKGDEDQQRTHAVEEREAKRSADAARLLADAKELREQTARLLNEARQRIEDLKRQLQAADGEHEDTEDTQERDEDKQADG